MHLDRAIVPAGRRALRVLIGGLLLATAMAQAQAPATLDALEEGTRIGSFRSTARYHAAGDRVVGARFVHEPTGMPVDILRFDSVPQALFWIETAPDSDRGEPHTGEHLVLGKGTKGRLLALTLDMSMGSNSAFTARDKTVYHFHTAGGRQSFLELTYRMLDALLHPDFADDEIRREVAHLGVVEDPATGELSLEEKGSVYLEMVSRYEKPGVIIWSEIRSQVYGADHPLGRVSGGRPDAIRTMEPEHIRAFFERCYRPGENMGLIVGLPQQFDVPRFLADLEGLFRKVFNGYPHEARETTERTGEVRPSGPAEYPPVRPPADSPTILKPFPTANASERGAAVFGWNPHEGVSSEDLFRLQVFMHVLAGDESSYLYKDLVDRTRRRAPAGIPSVDGWIVTLAGHPAMLWLDGVDATLLNEAALAEVRAVVSDRLRWIASLTPGSAELAAFNEKARTHLIASRRDLLEQTDAPPRFGYRGTSGFWCRHLLQLTAEPGYDKDLLLDARRHALEEDMASGNVWSELISRFELDRPPTVVAAHPDTSLPQRLVREKEKRLRVAAEELHRRYPGGSVQDALRGYQTDSDRATAVLDESSGRIARPGFVSDPPLTLDEMIDTRETHLMLGTSSGETLAIPIYLNRFGQTSTVDVGLYFDVTTVRRDELIYLPLLPQLITDLGLWQPDSTWMPYDELTERLRREVHDYEARYATFPREDGGRVELAVYASGLGADEARVALTWMTRLLESATHIGGPALVRLRDLVDREISAERQRPLGQEEYWANDPVRAYRYQNDHVFLSAESIFTKLHHLNRLSWRLRDAPAAQVVSQLAHYKNELLGRWDGSRAGLFAELDSMEAALAPLQPLASDFTGYLRAELQTVPDENLRRDLMSLYVQTLDDLTLRPERVMSDLSRLVARLTGQGPSRAHLTGNRENVAALQPELEVAIARLVVPQPPADERLSIAERHIAEDLAREPDRLGRNVITHNLRSRYPWLMEEQASRPLYAALVLETSRSALFANTAELCTYDDTRRSDLIDYLAAKSFGGAGAHGLFMRTWGAGLAYSNGVGSGARSGRLTYYAERCSDGVETLRFITGELNRADETLDDVFFLDYALAQCFADYRAADTYIARGRSMAADLTDGITPEKVRDFKRALLNLQRSWKLSNGSPSAPENDDVLREVRESLPRVVGPVVPGYGDPASERRRSVNFMIGPPAQITAFENHLAVHEPDARLVRLYPRDDWID